jgi:hypothetical protein
MERARQRVGGLTESRMGVPCCHSASSPSDMSLSCTGDLDTDLCRACKAVIDGVQTWQYCSYAALSLTFLNIFIFRAMIGDRSKWDCLWKTSCGFGVLKILAAIFLYVTIPDGSKCSAPGAGLPAPDMSQMYIYPTMCVFLGLVWIGRGYRVKTLLEQTPLLPVTGGTAAPAAYQPPIMATPVHEPAGGLKGPE